MGFSIRVKLIRAAKPDLANLYRCWKSRSEKLSGKRNFTHKELECLTLKARTYILCKNQPGSLYIVFFEPYFQQGALLSLDYSSA